MLILSLAQSLAFSVLVRAVGSVIFRPDDPCVTFNGRFNQSEGRSAISFDSPGVEISFGVEGAASIDLLLSAVRADQPNRFWVYVDGVLDDQNVIDTFNSKAGVITKFQVASGLSVDYHNIKLVKITEADWNNPYPEPNFVTVHGFVLDAGYVSCPDAPASSRRIEFIGDSITAGYCNLCHIDTEETAGYAQESFAVSWPTLVSNALGASYHASAWSGFGLVRNCCGGETHMPEVFGRTLASVAVESPWDFSRWVPDAVVINLGTNDNLNGSESGDVEELYQQQYIDFVRNISALYQSANEGVGPTFFLACGPMSEQYCPYVLNVISSLEASYPVLFLDQRNVLNSTNMCCRHPDAVADQTISDLSVPVIGSAMQWTYSSV